MQILGHPAENILAHQEADILYKHIVRDIILDNITEIAVIELRRAADPPVADAGLHGGVQIAVGDGGCRKAHILRYQVVNLNRGRAHQQIGLVRADILIPGRLAAEAQPNQAFRVNAQQLDVQVVHDFGVLLIEIGTAAERTFQIVIAVDQIGDEVHFQAAVILARDGDERHIDCPLGKLLERQRIVAKLA